jgi:hypothetical protein
MVIRFAVVGVLLLSSAGLASAQSTSRTGLTMGFPGAIGIVWQNSERLAFRPELSISKNSSTPVGGLSSSANGWGGGVGISTMVYGKEVDRVRTYFSPRFAWARATQTIGTATNSGNTYTVSGSFGADCAVTKRFALFGELGFAYGRSDVTISASPVVTTTSKTKNLGIRSAVGITWYFN